MSALASLRRIGIVAWTESTRTRGSFDAKTSVTLLALGLIAALLLPPLMDEGLQFDRGLYRVAIAPDSPLLPAVQASRHFQIVPVADIRTAVDHDEADLGVTSTLVYAREDAKGEAALAQLRQAAKDHAYRQLALEPDDAAAFPVRVELVYVEQQQRPAGTPGVPAQPAPLPTPTPSTGETGETGVSGGRPGAGTPGQAQPGAPASGFSLLPPERSVNTPETLSPPFPFRSLLLAYAFLIPMNFVVQVYAGSAIAERLDRKGEPLLASPARPWEVITGKALPYFVLMMAICAAIVVLIGGTWLSLLAVTPLALAFLALEFVSAMYARSFRELTFLTVFTSVLITIYAFLPAVFSDVHPISLVSPITLVVMDLRGEIPGIGAILYALGPLTVFSAILFVLGAALYREEDLFHQKPILAKAIDSVARQVRGLGSAIKLPFLLIPLVLIAELMLITFLFAWPVPVGLVGILTAVALVEETFKAAPSYAGVRRGIIPAKRAMLFGALIGLGFFLAEKAFLIASLAGLLDVPAGAAVLGANSDVLATPWWKLLVFLAMPLTLHVATAALTGWGAGRSQRVFGLAFVLAIAVHLLYDLAVVAWMGGALR